MSVVGYDDPTFQEFVWSLVQQESGGNYQATNDVGALGAYQVMSYNVPTWSKAILGHSVTPTQYLASPTLQDQVAQGKLLGYWNSHADLSPNARVLATAQDWNPTSDPSTYAQPILTRYQQDAARTNPATFGSLAATGTGSSELTATAVRTYPKPPPWYSFNGAAIPAPPGDIVASTAADSKMAPKGFDTNQTQYPSQAAMREWVAKYWDGGWEGGAIKADQLTTNGLETAYTLAITEYYTDHKDAKNSGTFDPGPAVGGLGPLTPSWLTSLENIFSWLTTASNWKRIGLFALGGAVLLFAAYRIFKNASSGGPATTNGTLTNPNIVQKYPWADA